MKLANAYVPFQEECIIYKQPEEGLRNGTIFPALNIPYVYSAEEGCMEHSDECE